MKQVALCRASELSETAAISRDLDIGKRALSVLLIKIDGAPTAYLNSCPHTGVRLEWRENDFMDVSGRYLQCAMHGALFVPNDGRCVEGPCAGESLVRLPLVEHDGMVYLSYDEALPHSAGRRK